MRRWTLTVMALAVLAAATVLLLETVPKHHGLTQFRLARMIYSMREVYAAEVEAPRLLLRPGSV